MELQKATKEQSVLIRHCVKEFKEAIDASAESMKKAAMAYYKAIKLSPDARKVFSDAFPTVSSSTWNGFVKVASNRLDERLLFDASAGGVALARCDIDTQRLYLTKPVAVAVENGDHLMVHVDKMTSEQVRQVFNHGVVRDLPEQRAWIETQKTRLATRKAAMSEAASEPKKQAKKREPEAKEFKVWIAAKRIHFTGNGSMTASELAEWLGKML